MSLGERARESLRALLPRSWRDIIPPRSGGIRLFTSFSSYVLVASALATAVGKALAVSELGAVSYPFLLLLWALSSDGLVYFGVAALLALLESRFRRAWVATVPLALAGAITATLNTGYLIITGEQASWEAFTQLFSRIQDVADITGEGVDSDVILRIVVGLAVGIAFPLILRYGLKRRRWSFERRVDGRARMLTAAWLAVAALVVMVATPRPSTAGARNLGKNALLSTLRTFLVAIETGSFDGYSPVRLVSKETLARFAERDERPNVIVVVLESTRYDKTSLSGGEDVARTPNLEALAREGLVAHSTRAVLPHTTKSLFSILCGRFPTMQKRVVEVSDDLRVQCLPSMLTEAGYSTIFFQSSWGTFEWRPRLVHRLGYQRFKAWEDIQGQSLGYLASDDESLVKPFGAWLDEVEADDKPFFATFLTSATHHPYRLSRRASKRARADKEPHKKEENRYLRLVEAEDAMLGGLLGELESRGLSDNTYVVVVGDHGEGFGEKGVKQHDNNFYEEGLRVPLVIAGPGLEHYEVPGNASLIDVTPTLLQLLGIPVDAEAEAAIEGFDLLDEDFPGDSPRWFSCWFEMRCQGFVIDHRKVVYEPSADETWYFDLEADPEENEPLVLTRDLEEHLKVLKALLKRHRARRWRLQWGEVPYEPWVCAEGERRCKHPKAKKEKNRVVVPFWLEGAKDDAKGAKGAKEDAKAKKGRALRPSARKGRSGSSAFSREVLMKAQEAKMAELEGAKGTQGTGKGKPVKEGTAKGKPVKEGTAKGEPVEKTGTAKGETVKKTGTAKEPVKKTGTAKGDPPASGENP